MNEFMSCIIIATNITVYLLYANVLKTTLYISKYAQLTLMRWKRTKPSVDSALNKRFVLFNIVVTKKQKEQGPSVGRKLTIAAFRFAQISLLLNT